MWGKIIIPMYMLWLHSLYGPRCPLSPKRPINLISLSLCVTMVGWVDVLDNDWGEFRHQRAIDISRYIWHHMASEILVNIGSGNGLMPDGTKPFITWTNVDLSSVAFSQAQVHMNCSRIKLMKFVFENYTFKIAPTSSRGQWITVKSLI